MLNVTKVIYEQMSRNSKIALGAGAGVAGLGGAAEGAGYLMQRQALKSGGKIAEKGFETEEGDINLQNVSDYLRSGKQYLTGGSIRPSGFFKGDNSISNALNFYNKTN